MSPQCKKCVYYGFGCDGLPKDGTFTEDEPDCFEYEESIE